jgi:hypothetical protein
MMALVPGEWIPLPTNEPCAMFQTPVNAFRHLDRHHPKFLLLFFLVARLRG